MNIWRVILDRKGAAPAPLRLVEVTPAPSAAPLYGICVGPFRVEVDDGFEEATLRRLLAVVAAC